MSSPFSIFENYCDFLNYFDSSITVQLSFLNQVADVEEFHSQLEIDGQDDEFNDIRQEYTEMLKNQLAKGNNGLVKTKYITFGVKEKSLKEAKPKLEHIEADIFARIAPGQNHITGQVIDIYDLFLPWDKLARIS